MRPDISVVVPVYNGEKYLSECLNSLVKQSVMNYEIICVNDGSTDSSRQILEKYKNLYPDVIKAYHNENRGAWFARKFGIAMAKGLYIGFCDCDDTIAPNMYETLYEIAKVSNADFAVCAFKRIDAKTGHVFSTEMTQFGKSVLSVEDDPGSLAVINASLWNKLFRKELLENIVDLQDPPRALEDMMFLTSIYPKVKHIAFTSEPLYHYMVREGSVIGTLKTGDIEKMKRAMLCIREYVFSCPDGAKFRQVLDLIAFIHFGISLVLRLSENKDICIRNIIISMKILLDNEFPTWRKSPLLRYRYVSNHRWRLLKPMIVHVFYTANLFPLFIKLYKFFTNTLKIDIKW